MLSGASQYTTHRIIFLFPQRFSLILMQFQLLTTCVLGCRQTNHLPDNTLRTSNGFWIGARRWNTSDCTSPLEWTSNSDTTFPIEYNNWAPYEPNCGSNSEACASINKWHNSKWNDLLCAWSACPLCEITIRI